ncbi:MAG: cysteine dioxygenase family protein [Syntrophothermus sp.]|uniref:cysteine dioxygenase family protein n=1 Tax=Syntrophothermus sp. TaxID=2736299 RepID=UPI0025803EB7|nr:cysteine dioxygenase family protein [Syntrophothermus sp.]NSW81890.1 cysteine dioxygenase family protein [Syntrophothermus sp.]
MDLNQFVEKFEIFLKGNPPLEEIFSAGRSMVGELVSSPGCLNETLTRLVLDDDFLNSQWHAIDPNDIVLYRHPEKLFTVRAFIWEPGAFYPVHDHGSWGLVGAYINRIRERKYIRTDDGSNEKYADIEITADAVLDPGQTTYVEFLGLHQMEAAEDKVTVTIHVYGKPMRKGYIQLFNLHNKRIHRVYAPSLFPRVLAIRTLGSISEDWAKEMLRKSLSKGQADYLQKECLLALHDASGGV